MGGVGTGPGKIPPKIKPRLLGVLLDGRIALWNLIIVVASPFLLIGKIKRYLAKGHGHEFNLRRWTVPAYRLAPEGPGPSVVFVGASVGEALMIEKLTARLLNELPGARITWTIRDSLALDQLMRKPEVGLAIWPFDFVIPILKWLRQNDPDYVVFTERYRFVNFAACSKAWGAKVALVNGRATRGHARAKGPMRYYYRWLFGTYDAMAMQSEVGEKAVMDMVRADCDVRHVGNIKFDLEAPAVTEEQARSLEGWLSGGEAPLLAAGSTTDLTEDAFVIDAFLKVREGHPCRLLLAPRKLSRISEQARLVEGRGLRASLRSSPADGPADVYLLDTMGELAYAYRFAVAAHVGGSLTGTGHNVVEPVEWGIPVSYGPRRGHFEAVQRTLEDAGAGVRVGTSEELGRHWIQALTDEDYRECVRRTSADLLNRQRGATERTANMLLRLVREFESEG